MTDLAPQQTLLLDAIWFAAWNDDAPSLELLLSRGANIDGTGSNGMPALQAAIENWAVDATELLLSHGASVGVYRNEGGWSPLSHIVERATIAVTDCVHAHVDCRIVALLIQHGADPTMSAPPLRCSPREYAQALCENDDTREIGEAFLAEFRHAKQSKSRSAD